MICLRPQKIAFATCLYISVMLISSYLLSCGKINSDSKILAVTECSKNPDLQKCNPGARIYEIVSNPSTVLIDNPKKKSIIIAKSGDMVGLSIVIPKESFAAPITLSVDQNANTGLTRFAQITHWLSSRLGIASQSRPVITLTGSSAPKNPFKITLAKSQINSLTVDELAVFKVKFESARNSLIPRADISLVEKNGAKTYSFSATEWGRFSVLTGADTSTSETTNPDDASDKTLPTATLSSTAGAVTNVTPIPVSITFSKSVTGFDATDLVVTGASAGTVSGSGTSYTVDITPTGQGIVTVDLPAGKAIDSSGNSNSAATQLSRTYDSVAPTVVLTSSAAANTGVSPIPVTATFSESVTGVALTDFTISGGTAGNLAGSGTVYTFDVTPSGIGTVTVDMPALGTVDAAGNGNIVAAQLSRVYNNVNPSVTLTTGAAYTTVAAITVTATFSAAVTGFVSGDITPTNAVVSGFAGSGTTYTFTLTASGQGAFSAEVAAGTAQDISANLNTASNVLTTTYDNVAPTIVITSAAAAVTPTSPIPVTFTFSETVTGFAVGDISVGNGTAGNFAGSGAVYTADITPTGQGAVTVNVAGSVAQDLASNNNSAAVQLSRTYDSVVPTVVITSTSSATTTTSPIPVTFTFSESVTGFVLGDITVSSGTAGNFAGSGAVYTADITPTTDGTVTVDVAGSTAVDTAGNNNTSATQLSRVYDGTAPSPGNSGTITSASVTATSMTLNWTAATDAVTAQASLQYEVRQSSSNNIATVANAEANGSIITAYTSNIITTNVTGLTVSTGYYFTVIVRDLAGRKSVYSTLSQSTTADLTAPTAGTMSASTGVGNTGLTLNWSVASDNVTAAASLEYFVCSGASAAAIDTVAECEGATQEMAYTANTLTRVITGLSPSTTYFYNVVVKDSANNKSIYDGKTQATTADVTMPTAGSFSASTGISTNAFTLNWSAGSDNVTAVGALQYFVCSGLDATSIDTVAECDGATQEMAYSTNILTLAINGKSANTTYYYNVIVRDAAGNKSIYNGKTEATSPSVTWAQEAYIKAANAGAGDNFGSSVAISGDTIVASSPSEASNQTTISNGPTASPDNSSPDAGAAYIFKRTGATWAQEAYIKAANAEANDYFGRSIAVSGDTVVIGGMWEDSNQTTITNGTTASANNSSSNSGAAYVYKRIGTTWSQEAYIKAVNADAQDRFGDSIAVSGDTIAVGAIQEASNQNTITNGTTASSNNSAYQSGAVYIYKRAGTTWAQEAYIKAANQNDSDFFGFNVAVSADTVVVGAYHEDSNQTTITNGTTASADNTASSAGAVYVYKRTGTTWTQEAYIKAANADVGDQFGRSVAVSGDTVVVGAGDEDSNQTTITNGTAASADNSASNAGTVYVYKRTGATWAQEAYIKASNAGAGDNFGVSVGISGDTLVAAAHYEASNQTIITNGTSASANNSSTGSGAAYVYKRTGATWAQEAYIKAANADSSDNFGSSVAIFGDTLVVGAPLEDSNQTTITNGTTASSDNSASASGAVYVYKRTQIATWTQQAYIKAANADVGDQFGCCSVAISNDTVVVGARHEDSNQTTITNGTTASSDNSSDASGAAYIYKRTGTSWAQEAYIKADSADTLDYFGWTVDISGDTVVIGAYGEDSNQTTITNGTTASADNSVDFSGATYIYKRTGTTWAQEAYIKAVNAEASDQFGWSVAISADTVVVSANGEDSNQTTITNGTTASADNSVSNSGAVYIYKRTGTTWAQEAYIKAANAGSVDNFGASVAIAGDTVVIGADYEDSNQTTITNGSTASADNSSSASGAVYIYKRTGTSWAQEAYIKAANAAASDSFGSTVAISGDTVVVGATGEDSNQTTITNGTTASADNSASDSGAIYVYKQTGTTWAQQAYIKAANTDAADLFGWRVAISGDTVVVGVYGEDSNQTTITNGTTASSDNSVSSSGAVYVYKRTGTAWAQEAYIKAVISDTNDQFGIGVAISGDTVVVGANGEDSNQTTITNGTTASSDNSATTAGAVYIYVRN